MPRKVDKSDFIAQPALEQLGFSVDMIQEAIEYVYDVLDGFDETLTSKEESRFAEVLELANLSAVIGNLFRGGIARASKGRFQANGPHKYPDLLAIEPNYSDVEIKVALETNNPKGHLVKPGPHVTVRYVLGSAEGRYVRGERGNVVWIWEVRLGCLKDEHFNVSNTEGDSGKTAVINSAGMAALQVVFCDMSKCPYSTQGPIYRKLGELHFPRMDF
ncbi:MAG: hypothetical protein JXA14_19095 [Anaerolineae bacterium]|nr:hypothetical protein [Anaerolineae bacterium]